MQFVHLSEEQFLEFVGALSQASPDPTELANSAFLTKVKSIPGVVTVKPYGGQTLADQSIAVVVPALRTITSRQVFELEGEILRAFPSARLNVRVIGMKEHNIDMSQVASVLPD